ncbi:o-succinylbenzoate--CoA ligase [Scopulibacillus darangshiensis]|nr:o-succinylbenzoate--CoA ligase [Scopulibacillus darangshiensis]
MNQKQMPNWLSQRAFLTPNRQAFISRDETVTFEELNLQALSLARKLQSAGAKRLDHIAFLCENSLDLVCLYHAVSYIGAVSVPLNTRLTVEEQVWQIEDSKAVLLICDRAHEEQGIRIHGLKQQTTMITINDLKALTENDLPLLDHVDLEEPHTIIYTSGTTGHPKGVILTNGNHWWNAVGSALNLGLQQGDKWLSCVPLFHVSGLSILMKNVIYGMTVVLHSTFDPEAATQAIKDEGVTMVSVVSAMLSRLLETLGEDAYPDTFRCMLLGGGPAPKVMLEVCKDKGIPIYQTYGLSETASQIVTLAPEYMIEKLGSAGKPLFPAEIKIMKDSIEAQPNKEGEIVVKGPNVTSGYLNRPEATEKVYQDGWFYTGDVGYLDDDGFLYVLDRRKDLIISGGENVYPAEIEAVLLQHHFIEEAGVIGVSHAQWGQVPAAFVTIKEGQELSPNEVFSFCKERLAGYKIPKYVYFVDELPRNASKKLLRRDLYKLLAK